MHPNIQSRRSSNHSAKVAASHQSENSWSPFDVCHMPALASLSQALGDTGSRWRFFIIASQGRYRLDIHCPDGILFRFPRPRHCLRFYCANGLLISLSSTTEWLDVYCADDDVLVCLPRTSESLHVHGADGVCAVRGQARSDSGLLGGGAPRQRDSSATGDPLIQARWSLLKLP